MNTRFPVVLISLTWALSQLQAAIPASVSARYGTEGVREVEMVGSSKGSGRPDSDGAHILAFRSSDPETSNGAIITIEEGTSLNRAIGTLAAKGGLGYSPSPKIRDVLVEVARIPEDSPLRMINALIQPYGYRALLRNGTVEVFGGALDDGMVPRVMTYKLKHVRFGNIADSPRAGSMVDTSSGTSGSSGTGGASSSSNGGGQGGTGKSVLDPQDLVAKDVNDFFSKLGQIYLSGKAFASLVYDARSRTISARDLDPYLEQLRQYLTEFDVPQRKVVVHIRLISVSHDKRRNQGIDYSGAMSAITVSAGQYNANQEVVASATASVLSSISPVVMPGFEMPSRGNLALGLPELSATLNLLKKFADVELVQDTFLMAQDGMAVHKFVGQQLFIVVPGTTATGAATASAPLTFRPMVGDLITFRPEIGDDGEITASFKLESSQEAAKGIYGGQAYPQFGMNDTQQFVTARDGQTIMLSGFLKDQISTEQTGLPILSDIPVVGPRLFGNTQSSRVRSVTLLLMTMQLINPNDTADEDRARDATIEHMKKSPSQLNAYIFPEQSLRKTLSDIDEPNRKPGQRSKAEEKTNSTPLPGAEINQLPGRPSSSVPVPAPRKDAEQPSVWIIGSAPSK